MPFPLGKIKSLILWEARRSDNDVEKLWFPLINFIFMIPLLIQLYEKQKWL